MEIRHPVHSDRVQPFDTEDMRDNLLVADLFMPDRPTLVYSFFDQLIIGGVGTAACAFARGMAGGNQDFDDMNHVPAEMLK